MNVENQNAVEENEVVSVDVEEAEQQASQSEIPVVPEMFRKNKLQSKVMNYLIILIMLKKELIN